MSEDRPTWIAEVEHLTVEQHEAVGRQISGWFQLDIPAGLTPEMLDAAVAVIDAWEFGANESQTRLAIELFRLYRPALSETATTSSA